MKQQNQELILQKTYSRHLTKLGTLLFIFSLPLIYLGLGSALNGWKLWISIPIISGFAILLLWPIRITNKSRKQVRATPNLQSPENLDVDSRKHDAFVVIESRGDYLLYNGLDTLIPKFKEKGYPFRIYYCKTPDDFKTVLSNEKANCVWIFGHGWRGGITFKGRRRLLNLRHLKLQDKIHFCYSNLVVSGKNEYPVKDFIVQLHCNHFVKDEPSNDPLPKFLMKDCPNPECYHVSDNAHNAFSIWFTTRKLAENLKRTPMNPDEERIIG